MCKAWAHQYGVPAKVARIYHTYGPKMSLDDGRVYADFVADILAGRDLLLKSDGSAVRIFCYLADATLGFFNILLKGQAGEAYNLADSGGELSIRALAEKLIALFPEKKLKLRLEDSQGSLPSGIARSLPDTSKIRALGWSPRTNIEEGFLRTVRSFQ
jgi:nucleoside-diphosphate-sugar epimerase